MEKKCIGIDVGGTTVKLGLFEADGALLRKWEVPTRKEEGGVHILPDVAASVRAVLEEERLSLSDVAGAGMGIPGPVLEDGYVEVCVNLGWRDMNPQQILSGLLDNLPICSGNDANVAAMGEMWQGGGKGYSDIVMVTLGTGVGGGVILNQKIVSGKHGLAGEIGHIRIRENEKESCNCKGHGCVEQIASATGIAREARRAMAAKPQEESAMRRFGDAVTARDVVDCAKAGDAMALEVMETVGYYLGWALAMVSMTVDPEVFVIGGGVSRAGSFLIDFIQKYYERFTPISENKAGIALATLGNDAGIYGAARLLL
ncbi:ROK family protein [Clostridiaceae bacterium]|nr:ROK family glucokinase [Clostridium sp.]NBI69825.1 ROK family protein [Clostridiaceae bacterium]